MQRTVAAVHRDSTLSMGLSGLAVTIYSGHVTSNRDDRQDAATDKATELRFSVGPLFHYAAQSSAPPKWPPRRLLGEA